MSFSVLSYNIRKCKGYRASNPSPADLAQYIADQDCDVVLCQEVAEKFQVNGQPHCCQISERLGMHHDYGPNACYQDGTHGNASFSALPVVECQNIDVSTSIFEHRGILHSVVELDDQTRCHFFNVHLGLTPGQRLKQIKQLMTYIESKLSEDEPVVIAGDFNDFGGRLKKMFAKLPGFGSAADQLTESAKTWPSHKPKFQLDYVFYRNLTVTNMQLLAEPATRNLSDHLALKVTFQ